jgi:bleomycin hydrolase
MGSNQSRPSDIDIQERLIERLQALHTKNDKTMNEKEGYVYIDHEARMLLGFCTSNCIVSILISSTGRAQTPVVAHKQDVSTAAIGEWEKELMEDPKARKLFRAMDDYSSTLTVLHRTASP